MTIKTTSKKTSAMSIVIPVMASDRFISSGRTFKDLPGGIPVGGGKKGY